MRNISVIFPILLLLGSISTIITANGQDESSTPSPAKVHDILGNLLDKVTVGQQVILSKTYLSGIGSPQPFVGLFEVRDSNGISVYIAWQSRTITPDGPVNMGVSWIADTMGDYQIRTYAISNFTNPTILETVELTRIPVVEASGA